MDQGTTSSFSADVGVKQGCPLSPVLFGIFIEACVPFFLAEAESLDAPDILGTIIPLLLYADDTSLCSFSEVGLQKSFEILSAFCDFSGMSVNVDKRKTVVFRNSKTAVSPCILYRGEQLEVVDEFRYLGIVFHAYKGFEYTLQLISQSASKKFYMLWATCREKGVCDTKTLLMLFRTLLFSILSYCCEVFSPYLCTVKDNDNPAELLQRRMFRCISGVCTTTPSILLLLEFGRRPVSIVWFQRATKYYTTLLSYPESSILYKACQYNGLGSWRDHLRQFASRLGGDSRLLGDFSLEKRNKLWVEVEDSFLKRMVSSLKEGLGSRLPLSKPLLKKYFSLISSSPCVEPQAHLLHFKEWGTRSCASALRLNGIYKGINVWEKPFFTMAIFSKQKTLFLDKCPHCDHKQFSYEHSFSCTGFKHLRDRFSILRSFFDNMALPSLDFIHFIQAVHRSIAFKVQ